ncbi:MAG TPA: MEDS domain-containing protein [Thermoanaerobaculia bacterium]|jgi:PAS domain S-box-containing protein|nr:MEDS domain-containing protein [Thermoanaerobaculia bacterium]
MAVKKHAQPRRTTPTLELGIAGWRVPLHAHIAYLWETEADFAAALGFVEAGLRGGQHSVVIVAPQDGDRIRAILRERGLEVESVQVRGRLSMIERGQTAQQMLDEIAATFEAALAAGAPHVRLFGDVGWGRANSTPDAELLSYEARLTDIAERFPCVILCTHEVHSLTGLIARHGVFATHPRILEEGGVLGNPYFVPLDRFRERLGAIGADLAERQREREALRRQTEILQAIFANSPAMIALIDPAGRLMLANREWERVLGWTLEEAQRIDIGAELYPDAEYRAEMRRRTDQAERRWTELTMRTRDGRTIEASWAWTRLSDGSRIWFGRDVTERRRAEEALRQSYDELRALSERLRAVREEESARIAREVHDEVGQSLTAVRLDADWLQKHLASATGAAGGEIPGKLRSMVELLDSALDSVQRVVTELRPGVLDELGLEAAVEWYVKEFQRRSGLSCTLRSNLGDAPLDPDRATALFRILQEALTNVVRHAEATAVEIRLSAEEGRIVLAVSDNGLGIPEEKLASSRSLGLVGMRERARSLGGEVAIRRAAGRGTTVEASLPL